MEYVDFWEKNYPAKIGLEEGVKSSFYSFLLYVVFILRQSGLTS
jgi:hypothetical protein